MLRLNVVIASTRPGRVGKPVGAWFQAFARQQQDFDAHWTDLG